MGSCRIAIEVLLCKHAGARDSTAPNLAFQHATERGFGERPRWLFRQIGLEPALALAIAGEPAEMKCSLSCLAASRKSPPQSEISVHGAIGVAAQPSCVTQQKQIVSARSLTLGFETRSSGSLVGAPKMPLARERGPADRRY
jgi:hypothetical protein